MEDVDDAELRETVAFALRELDRVWPRGRAVPDQPSRLYAVAVVAHLRRCGFTVQRPEPDVVPWHWTS